MSESCRFELELSVRGIGAVPTFASVDIDLYGEQSREKVLVHGCEKFLPPLT